MIYFVDGSARPSKNEGGFGVVLFNDNESKLIDCWSEQFKNVTNNQMELLSIIYVMNMVDSNDFSIPTVYSDSSYAVNTFTKWMFNWAENNWTKADGKIPENLELIQIYYKLYQNGKRINLKQIKGHNNIRGNELADKLATGEISVLNLKKSYGLLAID